MSLSFLPQEVRSALDHLNFGYLTEIRFRAGQPLIIGYKDDYAYLGMYGIVKNRSEALKCGEIAPIINAATGGSIYSYAEQMRNGFITCSHGVRIGLAGQYVTQNGKITAIGNVTSLNIRIPHEIKNCSSTIYPLLTDKNNGGVLICSKPGMGKTTMLRDIAQYFSEHTILNVLVFDERGEISAMDERGNGFDLGERVDIVRAGNKTEAFAGAIRAMKPDVIITDELYGEEDVNAVEYAKNCGIKVIASSHITDKNVLCGLPFDFYVEIKKIGGEPIVYDKNFVACACGGTDRLDRNISFV